MEEVKVGEERRRMKKKKERDGEKEVGEKEEDSGLVQWFSTLLMLQLLHTVAVTANHSF